MTDSTGRSSKPSRMDKAVACMKMVHSCERMIDALEEDIHTETEIMHRKSARVSIGQMQRTQETALEKYDHFARRLDPDKLELRLRELGIRK